MNPVRIQHPCICCDIAYRAVYTSTLKYPICQDDENPHVRCLECKVCIFCHRKENLQGSVENAQFEMTIISINALSLTVLEKTKSAIDRKIDQQVVTVHSFPIAQLSLNYQTAIDILTMQSSHQQIKRQKPASQRSRTWKLSQFSEPNNLETEPNDSEEPSSPLINSDENSSQTARSTCCIIL